MCVCVCVCVSQHSTVHCASRRSRRVCVCVRVLLVAALPVSSTECSVSTSILHRKDEIVREPYYVGVWLYKIFKKCATIIGAPLFPLLIVAQQTES